MPIDHTLPPALDSCPLPASDPAAIPQSPTSSLSSLSSPSLSPSQAVLSIPQPSATLTRQTADAVAHFSRRCHAPASDDTAQDTTSSVRRILPLGTTQMNTAGADAGGTPTREKGSKAGQQRTGAGLLLLLQPSTQPHPASEIVFPPPNVVLHPKDESDKTFAAMYRAFMRVDNRAMTIKDLTDLATQFGLCCPSASAASQAITFFIRSHLQRCEAEDDFPVLLRLNLSGTEKDDALLPALYSRSGGNVANKDKTVADENGVVRERLTCFRRGTTVWYLSRVVGAPCPFARAGIAPREFAEGSAISSIEGRKADEPCRDLKRKRERRRGRLLSSDDEEDIPAEDKKPPKIKLTLRLRPCLTTIRDKPDEVASSPESEVEASTRPVHTDTTTAASATQPDSCLSKSDEPREATWSFPPFPIQRQISIPPYTPAQESFPFVTSPHSESGFALSDRPGFRPKLELACIDEQRIPSSSRQRAGSLAFSVASPPPDSDDDFSMDEDDDLSFSMSPVIRFKEENDLAYEWPQAAPSSSSLDLARIKVEPEDDAIPSKRSSVHTLTNVKSEEMDLSLDELSLFVDERLAAIGPQAAIKIEDGGEPAGAIDAAWNSLIDLTNDEDFTIRSLWKNVEILGPESVDKNELDVSSWDAAGMRSVSPDTQYAASIASPPSLAESIQSWSVSSPDTDAESTGPLSPPTFDVSEPEPQVQVQVTEVSPSISAAFPSSIEHSEPWTIPGKDSILPMPSRLGASAPGSPLYPINESDVPWERGRYTAEDVHDHLLHPSDPLPFDLPTIPTLDSEPSAAPLSPQEEAVFESLCFDPAEPSQPTKAQASISPNPFANVLAAATRPVERLRERRSSRLVGETERARSQSVQPQPQSQPAEYAVDDDDELSELEELAPERVTRSKANAKAPVRRRSKRVASTSAPQRKSQRLRGKAAQ